MRRDRFGYPVLSKPDVERLSTGVAMGTLCLFVKGEPYQLQILPPGGECLIQARVSRPGTPGYVVTLDRDGRAHCECGDHHFRRENTKGLCKHASALAEAGIFNLTWRTDGDD